MPLVGKPYNLSILIMRPMSARAPAHAATERCQPAQGENGRGLHVAGQLGELVDVPSEPARIENTH